MASVSQPGGAGGRELQIADDKIGICSQQKRIGFFALQAEAQEVALFSQSSPGIARQNLWAELQIAAMAFGLYPEFTRADIETAFRRLARKMHPDVGGTHEAFQNLVYQRDLLLGQVRSRA